MSVNESILVELNETQTRTLTLCPTPAFVRALTTELKPGLGSLESKGVALQFDFFQFYFFFSGKTCAGRAHQIFEKVYAIRMAWCAFILARKMKEMEKESLEQP